MRFFPDCWCRVGLIWYPGGILFGYDTGVISGVKEMKDWLRTFGHPDSSNATGFNISSSTESLVVSILSAGTFFGALLGAPTAGTLSYLFGRRLETSFFVFPCQIILAENG